MIDRNVSFSQLKSWQDCRRQWAYKFRDGYRPTAPKQEFMRGTMLHLGMELALTGGTWDDAVVAWEEEWGATENLVVEPGWFEGCKEIVDGAIAVFNRDWRVIDDARGPLIERRMYINLPQWYRGIVFIPDVVAEKRREPYKGGVFGIDFKSFGKPKEALAGDVDLQSAIYQYGLRSKGYKALGSCMFQMATEPRRPVRLKKDGEPYAGDQERFDNWSAVTGQILTVRSDDMLDGIWNQAVLPVIQQMWAVESLSPTGDQPPHLDYYGCKYCEFFAPCQARLKGHDEDAILADNYTRRVPRQKGV